MKNDLEIQQDVMNELKWQPFLKASTIGVSVKDGIVTLSGNVDSYAQKIDAERIARKVAGVKAIAENIQIGVSPVFKKTDTEIAESVLNALKWHSAVPEEKIRVKVEDGVVTLDGEVEWDYQRSSAKNAITGLLGVRNVINLITVQPKAIASDIKFKISQALRRTAAIDAERINVDIAGTRVILHGKVRSFAEKEDIESAVWCAPGVNKVESYLEVEPAEVYTF